MGFPGNLRTAAAAWPYGLEPIQRIEWCNSTDAPAAFGVQSNNVQRIKALRDSPLDHIHARMTDGAQIEARETYLDALKRSPSDHFLHENFAAFLTATGDLKERSPNGGRSTN